MIRSAFVGLFALVPASASLAQPNIIYEFPISFSNFSINEPLTVLVPGFDTLGGTRPLAAVALERSLRLSFDLSVENLSGTQGQVSGFAFESHVFTFPGEPGNPGGSSIPLPTFTLPASDGIPGSGRDFQNLGTRTMGGGALTSTFDTAGYLDRPTVPFTITFTGLGGQFTGPSPLDVRVTNTVLTGTYRVIYSIPSPTASALLLFGVAGMTRRRRSQCA